MSGDPIRIGIIGTGGIARSYARAYREIPEAEIVGLCDIVPGKAAAYGEREGFTKAKSYIRYQDMLEDLELDAISVSTPNASHAFITID
mgnify:FL=1